MTPAESHVRELLAEIVDPHTGIDLAAGDAVRAVGVDGDRVAVEIALGYPAKSYVDELAAKAKAKLEGDPAIAQARVSVSARIVAHKVQDKLTPLPGVKNIIAVASGKGGVGKSTVAANLALALVAEGANVGVLDADIYGPSQPRMFGLEGRPDSPDGRSIEPMTNHGVQLMSIGFLVGEDTPMIWRGPMVTQALTQLLNDTLWRELDYLVIDLPPGTGDIQLTLAQRVPVAGAVIVTTPQDIALLDAKQGLQMFQKVEVPVLGIVENMATHVCSQLRPRGTRVRRGWRRAHGGTIRRAAAGLPAAGHPDPRTGRWRQTDRRGDAGFRSRRALPRDRPPRRGAVVAAGEEQGHRHAEDRDREYVR